MNKVASVFLALLVTGCFALPQSDYYDYGDGGDGYDGGELVEDSDTEDPIEEDPPVFQDKSRTVTVREGANVELSCKIVKPTRHILIFKKVTPNKSDILIYVGEMKLDQNSRFNATQNVFWLSNVSRADAGIYNCQYQSFQDTEIKYVLDVQFPPSIRAKSPRKQRVNKGDSVTMECDARGNPEPLIKWSKESGKLPSGLEVEQGYSMTLENVDRHVEGTYNCTAENGIGSPASASMKLLVEYPPEITTEKAIIRTGEGDKVELVCIVHARPSAQVSWSKDGSPLTPEPEIEEFEGGHRHAITITQVTEHNFGTYQCNAVNEKGENSATISLTDLPKQPQFTSPATSAEETSYTLAWETESYYPITEYSVKYRLAKANDSTDLPGNWTEHSFEVPEDNVLSDGLMHSMKHTINDLIPATDYQAIVSVKNKFKWGEEGKFNFSTRKASPTTTTIATTTITTTSPPLAEETVQNPHEETVSWHKTNGAGNVIVNFGVLVSTLAVVYLS